MKVAFLALAFMISGAAHAGEFEKGSLFGGVTFSDRFKPESLPAPKTGSYQVLKRDPDARRYVGSEPAGSMYLVENSIHGCKNTFHGVVDTLRTDQIERRLINASTQDVVVRVVTNFPGNEDEMKRLQRMLRAGVNIRTVDTPILENFAICDSKVVLRGVLEPYSSMRVSYGLGNTYASYNSEALAKEMESVWQKVWGAAAYLPYSTQPGNEHWALFGADLLNQNRPVQQYQAGQSEQYHARKKSNWLFRSYPFESFLPFNADSDKDIDVPTSLGDAS